MIMIDHHSARITVPLINKLASYNVCVVFCDEKHMPVTMTMDLYMKFMAFAMMAVFSLAFVSCRDDDDDELGIFKYGIININGKDYACYGYDMIATNESSWRDGTLSILIPLGELADAKKGEYDYDYMIGIECNGGNKPSVGTDLANYSEINVTIILNEVGSAVYESGSAVVKSIKDDDYITIEFKNFKCKTSSSQSYTFNGNVKLDYDVD